MYRLQIFTMVLLYFFLVLSDPQSRAVYDIYGKRGLDVEGWEVSNQPNTIGITDYYYYWVNRRYNSDLLQSGRLIS